MKRDRLTRDQRDETGKTTATITFATLDVLNELLRRRGGGRGRSHFVVGRDRRRAPVIADDLIYELVIAELDRTDSNAAAS